MRNLKKVLALVLTLVMALSMVTIASAKVPGTSFTDDSAIIGQYDEAVQVLEKLGVFQGRDDGSLDPNGEITRAEAAALIYRAVTGDTDDSDVAMFADDVFTDVDVRAWYSGYVNYCANHGIIRGHDDGSFKPMDPVTGYQAMAMILRAIGYNSYNEFTGDLWQEETAQYGQLTGISNTVTNAALRKNASRAMVGELLFRGIAKTSTVQYNALYKYESTNQTKGWEIFGLNGQSTTPGVTGGTHVIFKYDAAAGQERTESAVGYDAINDLAAMTERAAADQDTANTYTVRYGEPVAYWYRDTDKDLGRTNNVVIPIHFEPLKTYTIGVTEGALYTDFGGAGAAVTVDWTEDGVTTVNQALNRAGATMYGGKGTVLELYSVREANGAVSRFLVEKNTYTARVSTTYLSITGAEDRSLKLGQLVGTDVETPDYAITKYASHTATWASPADDRQTLESRMATLAGVTAGTVVIYNKYDGFSDYTTIKAAPSENATVNWTYDTTGGNTSWFTANGKNYEYNAMFVEGTPNILESYILNRDEVSWDDTANATDAFDRNQTLYKDDYGYVVHVTDQVATAATTGWAVITNAEFNNYRFDNGYVLNMRGYDINGDPINLTGAIDTATAQNPAVYAYGSTQAASAAAATFEMGIYFYRYNAGAQLYTVQPLTTYAPTRGAEIADPGAGAGTPILAGDANALGTGAADVLSNDTTFVIANYDNYGFITGYNVVKTGFKHIPDLYDANDRSPLGDAWIATADVDYEKQWINTGTAASDASIDLVFIRGARQEADTIGTAVGDNTFYVLDMYPQDFVLTYDVHPVVMNGQVTNMKFAPSFVAEAPSQEPGLNGGWDGMGDVQGFYSVHTYGGADRWVTSVTTNAPLGTESLDYLASGVLEGSVSGYVTMADNCQVYQVDLSDQNSTVLTSAQVAALTHATAPTCLVAARDAYGFATVIYVVIP